MDQPSKLFTFGDWCFYNDGTTRTEARHGAHGMTIYWKWSPERGLVYAHDPDPQCGFDPWPAAGEVYTSYLAGLIVT